MKKILVVFGTRPEAIKMAPVLEALKKDFSVKVCVTGQHDELLKPVLKFFNIKVDFDLDLMKPGQDLFDITIAVLKGMKAILDNYMPDCVLVHGDTTTTFAASIAAFYKKIPVGHVEAGLRTYDLMSPYPEEFNRQIVSRVTQFHFAPTESARANLIEELVDESNIYVTGNTVIDALLSTVEKSEKYDYPDSMMKELTFLNDKATRIILITGHRRENFGDGFEKICKAIKKIALTFTEVKIIYPVHLNPSVREPVNRLLSQLKNVYLIEPLEYSIFIKLMNQSYIILTDSGGIQEEAPSLGKPILVMRNKTERPEAVDAKTVKLVGTDLDRIIYETTELLDNTEAYASMARAINPYGDGKASQRIRDILMEKLL